MSAVGAVDGAVEWLDAVERATRLARQALGDTAQYRAIARYLVSRVLEEWPVDEEVETCP